MEQYLDFLREGVYTTLARLSPETPAQWGMMNAQQMVEHLRMPLFLSCGFAEIKPLFEADKLARNYQATIVEKRQIPRNIKFKDGFIAEPQPLEYGSLGEAIEGVREAIGAFFERFSEEEDQKNLRILHPVLGMLSYQDWLYFHCKHIWHHSIQFGLLPDEAAYH